MSLNRIILASAVLIGSAGQSEGETAALPTKPNVILIMADDLGWQDVGYMGAEFFETPNIDRLAAQGMRFTAAYSGGPNCAPTRACLLPGMYTPRHHIYTPGGKFKGKTEYMLIVFISGKPPQKPPCQPCPIRIVFLAL